MFRARVKYKSGCITIPYEKEKKTLESGVVVDSMVDQTEIVMPDAELFGLEDQLKAGIMLEEVNSKIRKGKSVDISAIMAKEVTVVDNQGSSEELDD